MSIRQFADLWDALCSGDETVEIEAKRAEEFGNSILETVTAFANEPNQGGGYLLLGVGQSATAALMAASYVITGIGNPDQLQRELATKCRDMLNVPVRPLINVEQIEGQTVIVAFIPEAQPGEKPIYIQSKGLPKGAFRRIGSTDQHCTDEDIALFFQLRSHRTFDETPLPDLDLGDLDPAAINEYRRARTLVNPGATELTYGDSDLLHALGALTRHSGRLCVTIAGAMLFGSTPMLRRLFPLSRTDYIRVEGREWVPNPERRYQSIELLEALVLRVPHLVNLILDDLPKTFSLVEDGLYRRDVTLIPRTVVREAAVNMLAHRDYRSKGPSSIIRYANRVEIRNPGHSLVPEDLLGDPNSVTRNERIAAVLRDIGLAENKGTGIRAMRDAMHRANLTAPLFESDRRGNTFSVTLLTHHLLGEEDVAWLGQFKDCALSEDEARALIVVREVGAINNASYRDINRLDTLTASRHLQRLRSLGLLEQRGRGTATYYVPGDRVRDTLHQRMSSAPPIQRHLPLSLPHCTAANPVDSPESMGLSPVDSPESTGSSSAGNAQLHALPSALGDAVRQLGRRSAHNDVRRVILDLCAWRPFQLREIAALLDRDRQYLLNSYLRPLVREGKLAYLHSENPSHPAQAYRTVPTGNA